VWVRGQGDVTSGWVAGGGDNFIGWIPACCLKHPHLNRPTTQPHNPNPQPPQALTFLLYRFSLWWWPGLHTLLLAAATSGGALTGISVYGRRTGGAGALHRTLRFDRHTIHTAFYRQLGGVLRVEGGAAAVEVEVGEAMAQGVLKGSDGSKGGGVDGDEPSEAEKRQADDDEADWELQVARAAAQLALECLGLEGGEMGEWCGGCLGGVGCRVQLA